MAHTAELREEFASRGFVVAEDLLRAPEIEQLARVLEEALRRRKAEEPRPLEQRSALNRQFTHCFNLWEEEPVVRALACDERICSIAAHLLASSSIRLFLDQTFFKEPGAEPTSRHQDVTRWPVRGRLLTAWIALDNVSRNTGALAYIPGSQAVGPSSWLDLVTGRQWTASQKELIDRTPEYVPVRRGSIIFHDSCTFHLSAPNRGRNRRRAFALVYASEDTVRSSSLPFPPLDWDAVEVGQKLTGPRNPVAWPRAGGDLPLPPPRPPEEMAGWPPPGTPASKLSERSVPASTALTGRRSRRLT
jgi:ectoine hydroxylase-related dioxygenase (phytanoyl-CoA dioxygenase family)